MSQRHTVFDLTADQVVELANRIMDQHPEADVWEIASGLIAGAVHYWLYAHQPCDDPACPDCGEYATAELRLRKLMEEVRQSAEESDFYHTPNDANVGRA